MNTRFKILIFSILILTCFTAEAQQPLTEQAFVEQVKKNHPRARKALLEIELAEARIAQARAPFDPLIKYRGGQKDWDNTLYYDQRLGELSIPTWLGVDAYAGTEKLTGSRLNNEETSGTVSYMGFSMPLLKGLWLDERRAGLKQAKLGKGQAGGLQRRELNDLLLEALQSYWNWWEQYHLEKLYSVALRNADQRFLLTRTAYQIGERAAIDTTEALTQVQMFQIRLAEIRLELVKARLALANYIWNGEGEPAAEQFPIPAETVPMPGVLELELLLQQVSQHPELQILNYRQRIAEIEKKLQWQSFLPSLDLYYNQYLRGREPWRAVEQNWFQNNYRYGITASLPLRFSNARGKYREARLILEQLHFTEAETTQKLRNQLISGHQELLVWLGQEAAQAGVASNYAQLQRGEEIRFSNGESSLFLVNLQEQRTLEAGQKLVELRAKTRQALVRLQWAAGRLGD